MSVSLQGMRVYTNRYTGKNYARKLTNNKPTDKAKAAKLSAAKDNFAKHMKGVNSPGKCKGKKGRAFYSCLASTGREAMHSSK